MVPLRIEQLTTADWRLPNFIRSLATVALPSARTIMPMNGFDHAIEEGAACDRIGHLPAVDYTAVAYERDALVEHLVAHGAGQHEPRSPQRRVIICCALI